MEDQTRPLVNWRVVRTMTVVVLVIGAVLIWKYADVISPPFKPPDVGMQRYRERLAGLASVSDNYYTLLAKADVFNKPALLKYLESLDHLDNDERLAVGQALDHGPILLSEGAAGFAEIHVPGDLKLDTLNWNSTQTQSAVQAGTKQHVEITPAVLAALAQRKQKLIDLGVSPPPPAPINDFAQTLRGGMSDNSNYGDAFICVDGSPLYKYPVSTAPPGSGLNKTPAAYTAAGVHVYKMAVFGNTGVIHDETRIKLQPNSRVSYYIKSDLLKESCQ
jgi:hypothetical protein